MIKVLFVLVLVLFVAQIIRVFEISSRINKNGNEVSDGSNNINGILLLLAGIGLIVFFFWQRAEWMDQTLQAPASEHGVMIDKLWDTTMGLIMFVFLLLTPMLFGIAYYFRGRKDRKASFITHNNKLEFFWTAIPAVTLLALISYGLNVWGKIVNQDVSDAIVIELYAKQFGWSARYAGEDNKLGSANVRYVGGRNELGVISKNTKEGQINKLSSFFERN
jgi:cytochrome c oxidase subunit 2